MRQKCQCTRVVVEIPALEICVANLPRVSGCVKKALKCLTRSWFFAEPPFCNKYCRISSRDNSLGAAMLETCRMERHARILSESHRPGICYQASPLVDVLFVFFFCVCKPFCMCGNENVLGYNVCDIVLHFLVIFLN